MNQKNPKKPRGPGRDQGGKPKERNSRGHRRRRRPNRNRGVASEERVVEEQPPVKHIPKRYGVVFYETIKAAKDDQEALLEKAREVDQLNIVIRAEAPMDDPDLLQYGKLYAGAAWALIHDRRVEDGWYNDPH